MKVRQLLAAMLLPLGGWIMSSAAHADTVMYDGTGFVVGTQAFVQSFNIATAGTLTVTLTNVNWPEQLASLNLVMSSTAGALGPEMGAGTSTFAVKSAQNVFAQWFGTAQGPLNAGVFSMKIDFQPNVVGTVPLPTSIALLLSGLALLLWHRRERVADDAEVRRKWQI